MKSILLFVSWLVLTSAVVVCSAIQVSVESQLILSICVIGILVLIKSFGLTANFQQLYISLSLLLVIRYFAWRLSSTIPSYDNLANFIPGLILLAAELYCLAMLAMSLFIIIDPVVRKKVVFSDRDAPTVDVFVPTYNESTDLLAVTLCAARSLDYPADKLVVYLLDDGGTRQRVESDDREKATKALERRRVLQRLCDELGAVYLTRDRNEHAKAGNLNYGLAHSTGDLVVVFDADHAPSREFLRETVGLFSQDPKLFLVQTPHFFLNPDPIEKNLGTFVHMPSENEMFYSLIQRGLDRWDASFFCGSAAVLRRQAIEQVGGFSGSSITEDCETALELHARGWSSAFVDRPMIAGLQPDTFEAFIGQRTRWCQGMVQLLLLKNPLLTKGLSFAQRVCYLSSIMYWLFPLARIVFLISPMFFIFLDLKIYTANRQEFIAYTVPYMISAVMLQNHNFGKLRWPWVSDVYEYVQSIYLLLPLLSVFLNPRKPSFNVTAKGQTLEKDHLSPLAGPQFLLYALVLMSGTYLAFRYAHEAANRDLFTVVGLWTMLNLLLVSLGLGVVCEARERRAAPRVKIARSGRLVLEDDQVIEVTIEDASLGGAAVRFFANGVPVKQLPAKGKLIVTEQLDGRYLAPVACEIRSRSRVGDEAVLGLEFAGPIPPRAQLAAGLIFADLSSIRALRAERNVDRGVLAGTGTILAWAAKQTVRSLSFLASKQCEESPVLIKAPAPSRAAPSTRRLNEV